jgi:hypothetical protein
MILYVLRAQQESGGRGAGKPDIISKKADCKIPKRGKVLIKLNSKKISAKRLELYQGDLI